MSVPQLLIRTGAFKRGQFKLASGKTSSFYVDAKQATSDPTVLATLAQHAALYVPDHDAVAGTVLGGVPIAVALGLETRRTILLVRPEPKAHGTGKQVEGPVRAGMKVLAVEDVATTGGSIGKAIDALRAAGCTVTHALVIVDREEGAREKLAAMGVTLHALVTLSELQAVKEAAP